MALSTPAIQHGLGQPTLTKISSFRRDIQGLRALAVLAVIADHMFGYPAGGFVGVDIFFVISGFIITGLLLREHEKTGRISFGDFYRRRVRRIMPVALVVLAATLAVSSYLFVGERARSVLWDGLWASVFGANWRYAATGTDYMQADGPVSPLQHYWSLSVEEQFYLVWPVLLVLVLGFAAKRFRWSYKTAKRSLSGMLAVIILGSLSFAYWETATAPTVAYFSTFSRTWELGVGAFIAVITPLLAKLPDLARPMIQWVGLIGIGVSLFVVTPQTPFPAPGALLPVLATALVIGGGVGGQRFMTPLTNRVSGYIGDISYSLYLWHFPTIILVEAALPDLGIVEYLCVTTTILLLSVASYHFIEDPLRHSQWLEPRDRRRRSVKQPFKLPFRTQILGLVLLAVASVALAGGALLKGAPVDRGGMPLAATGSQPTASASAPATPEGALQVEITNALNATAWPTLTPAIEDLGAGGFEQGASEGCAPVTPRGKDCSLTGVDSQKLAVVVGDSMGAAWAPAIRAALEPAGWTVRTMTYVGCPFLDADTMAADENITRTCSDHKRLVTSLITEAKPGLVIVSNLYNLKLVSGPTGDEAMPYWEKAATVARGEWLAGAEKVVTLAPPPAGKDPKECITRVSLPADCTSTVTPAWNAYAKIDQQVSTKIGDLYIDKQLWFCSKDQMCPVFADGTVIRRDATHITAEYATKLAPLMFAALEPALQ